MNFLLVIAGFLLLFLHSASLDAQNSSGPNSGSGGSNSNASGQAWPSNPNVRYPAAFPPRVNGVSPPAGVTWSGTLEETFVAVYIAPKRG